MVSLSRSLSVRERQRHHVAGRLGLGPCLSNLSLRARGCCLAVIRLGVALDFPERAMAGDRHDLVRGAAAVAHELGAALAQSVRDAALGQARFVAPRAELRIEALLAEWAAPLVDEERQRLGWARAGCDSGDEFCWQRRLNRRRLAPLVLLLGVDQPAVLHVLATERDAVTATKRDAKQQFEREPRLAADRMTRSELCDLLVGPGRVTIRRLDLDLDVLGRVGLNQMHRLDRPLEEWPERQQTGALGTHGGRGLQPAFDVGAVHLGERKIADPRLQKAFEDRAT